MQFSITFHILFAYKIYVYLLQSTMSETQILLYLRGSKRFQFDSKSLDHICLTFQIYNKIHLEKLWPRCEHPDK